MRVLRLGIGALVLSGLLAGCDSGGGEAALTPEQAANPKAGLDALNKMGPMPTAKTVKEAEAKKEPETKK